MAKGDNFRSSELLGVLNQVSSAINNSPSNLYVNPSVLKEILALDKELSSVLNDFNLTHNERSRQLLQRIATCSNRKLAAITSSEGKPLRIRSSNSVSRSSTIQKSKESSGEESASSSSISLYSTDSIFSEKSEEEPDRDRKKNLIIRCNYNSANQANNKNILHVFRHDSACQIPPPLCPDPCCTDSPTIKCRSRCKTERQRRVRKARSRESSKSRKSEERLEKARIKKEKKEKERQRKAQEKEKKEKERKEKKEKQKEAKQKEAEQKKAKRMEAKQKKSKTKCKKSDSEGSTEGKAKKEKSKPKTKEAVCEDSSRSRESIQQKDSESACKAGIQCEIPFLPPRCDDRSWFSCKGTQAANSRRRVPSDCQERPPCPTPCGRSRFARFLSSFGNGGLQLRLIPPVSACRITKSCTIPKLRLPRTITVDSSCGLPRIKFSRTAEPCRPPPCRPPPCRPPPCGTPTKSTPCFPRPCDPPPPCPPPCKLPKCTRAPSFPRTKPCEIPSCRLKPTCRNRTCSPAPCEPKPCTPPPPCIPRFSGPRSHTPPPCSTKPCGSFFPPKPKPCGARPEYCQPPPCDNPPCSQPDPCDTQPCYSRQCLTTPCESAPCTPRPCETYAPCTPPICSSRPCTPIRRISKCRMALERVCSPRPCTPTKCPSTPCNPQPCGPRPCTPPTCSARPCSLCGSRPCTPTRPCEPQSCFIQPCDPMPCSPSPCNPQPCDQMPCGSGTSCNPCPLKPCLSKPRVYEPCAVPSSCSRPCGPQPFSCDSVCDVRKWTCCTKRTRASRPCSPGSCSRVSICAPGPCRKRVFTPRITPTSGPAYYPKPCSPTPCGSVRICDHSPRCSDTNICSARSTCVAEKCYPKTCRCKTCRGKEYPPSCSDSDICHARSSCGSRRRPPSPVCPREDTCYLKRKHYTPWWTSRYPYDSCPPRPCSRSPSCYSLDGCSDENRYYRCRYGPRRYWSPYCSDDEFCYSRRYLYPPWGRYHPIDGPYCSRENICYRYPCPPRESASIPCAAARCRPRSCSPPHKSLSCSPPPCRTRCATPCRPCHPRPRSPPPCTPPYMPCPPYPQPCMPPYPPPSQPCPPPPYPAPCFPPPCPSYPSFSPTPRSSRTSEMSCGPQPCWGPMASNQDTGPPCGPSLMPRPRCIRSPPCLKKLPKPCGGKSCGKRCFGSIKPSGAKPCGMKPCSPPSCPQKPSNVIPPSSPDPCRSPTPSCGNVGYPCYPSQSCSSYGSNQWPYPSPSFTYPPYCYWPNYYQAYGGYPSCFPSQTYSGPGCRPHLPKLCLSKLKCSKLYHLSCESGLPRSSSVSSVSSCSSSKSSVSSSGSTYTSRSSSSSSSSSGTSPRYCVASCRNSPSNLFKCRRRVSYSSICSSSDSSPRRALCNTNERCHPDRQQCGAPVPCDFSTPLCPNNYETISCRVPVYRARSQVCSSATDLHCESKLRCKGIEHYDERIKFELQKIGINQLIQASKPAKCCKQTVLNQPSREELPYSASLASLPLDRTDIRVIRQSVRMASNKTECNYTSLENRTKLVYYANLVLDDFDTKKPKEPPDYEVYYFYFTLEDTESVQDTLKKTFRKSSTFKFFQIFNWSDKTSKVVTNSAPLNVDFATCLDLKQRITSPITDEDPCVILSGANSTDALEDIVFSDLFPANQAGVGDSKPGNPLDEKYINEIKLKKTRKKKQKLNMNFTMTESSLGTGLSVGRESMNNLEKATGVLPKKCNALSQTDITQLSPELLKNSLSRDVASQTNKKPRKVNNISFSEEIMRLLSSSEGDSVEYLKKNNNCLEFSSDATQESDSLDIEIKINKSDQNQASNDEEFKNASNNFEEAIKEVLGEIKELATMAESFKRKELSTSESPLESRAYMTKSTICSTSSSKPPFEEYKAPNDLEVDNLGYHEIVQKRSLTNSGDLFRKQISKGQFIVRMYNSVDEVIGEIYREAEALVELRKNRLAISGKCKHRTTKVDFKNTHCKKTLSHSDVGRGTSSGDKLMRKATMKEPGNSSENLKTVYTSAGKIIRKFYNSSGKAVKAVYNPEGERIIAASSPKKLARVLFDDTGKFISGYCDSRGHLLKAVYDSQRKLLHKTFDSEMLLIKFPSEGKKKDQKYIFNAQGFPIHQFHSEGGRLLTSIYDFERRLIRGTFLGNISQLFPRIFDRQGQFILGRYNRNGKMIKRIYDAHGNNLQQLYKSDRTTLQKAQINLKIFNQNGKPVKKIFRKNKIPLTHVYDVLGNLLCQASEGNPKDLISRLFDLDGYFIYGRLDQLRHLIEAVFGENGKKILQVQVLDSETGDMIKTSKLYNFNGKLLGNFFDESGVCLKSIHDVEGATIETSPMGRAIRLAGRMFDMAGYFIQGRYDAQKNLIREVYDHDGHKILQVYDVSGKPVRRIPQSNRIFNYEGKQIRHLYKSDHKILSSIYDINGDMIGGVLSFDAEELAPFLFDIEGKFINSRYDSQMSLIKHVYDSKENVLSRVYTQGSLRDSKTHKEKPKPVKTVFVKLECKEKPADGDMILDSHFEAFSKPISTPLTISKIPTKCSKLEVLPSRKRKRSEGYSEEGSQLVSVKCQCKIREKKENERRISSAPTGKGHSASIHHVAKRKKIEKKAAKRSSKKSDSNKRTERHRQNEHNKTTTSLHNSQYRVAKVLTTVLPCYETVRTSVQMNEDSLESLLDGYLQHGQATHPTKDKSHHCRKKPINHEMIEETLLDCLNLTKNPNSLKRMSHTILQYFTHVVFNQIKNNYYKQLSKKRKSHWGRRQDSTVLFFNSKYACGYALCNARKKNSTETIGVGDKLKSYSNVKQETPSNEPEIDTDLSNPEIEEDTDAESSQESVPTKIPESTFKDAFLCNIPNAPPFILKMNKSSFVPAAPKTHPEVTKKSEIFTSSLSITSTDCSFDIQELPTSASSTYTEIPDFNMFIDGNCPGFEDKEFKKFVAKSITWIKAEGERRLRRRHGLFMSTPTICMTGLTSISNNPFELDEIDSRRPGKNNASCPDADTLYNQNSNHYHSKIPRMLHPGKCKVHAKMKNVQLSPGSKGCAANKASTCSSSCTGEAQITPYVKVSVSTTCPSLTNTSGSGTVKGGAKQKGVANIQASQSSMGDCMKGIKSDPGCYCGNEPVETTQCPIRLREDCECVDEAEAQTVEEEDEALCYCPPGEQPLLLKKSNVECDCSNRRRCEDNILVEPPKEKPDVFWALTKVSLLKDGSKNFEIIDVSPVPPGYYLMPDVNNLVLVGPQPRPAKAAPSKNCCCK